MVRKIRRTCFAHPDLMALSSLGIGHHLVAGGDIICPPLVAHDRSKYLSLRYFPAFLPLGLPLSVPLGLAPAFEE